MARIGWLRRIGQFVKTATNTLLGRPQVQAISSGATRAVTKQVLTPLAGDLAAGSIPLQVWQGEMRQNIKNLYINQYIAGRGGREMMTQADWGRCGAMLKDQYKYLDGFARDLSKMDVKEREKYIANRAQLYANASNEAFERGRSAAAVELGYDEVHWNLTPAEHCDTCIIRSQIGVTEIGPRGGWMDPEQGEVWPADGTTNCMTNCKCFLSYSNSVTGQAWASQAQPSMGTITNLTSEQREEIVQDLLKVVPEEHTKGISMIRTNDFDPHPDWKYTAKDLVYRPTERGGYSGLYFDNTQAIYVHPAHVRDGVTLYHEVGHHVTRELADIVIMPIDEMATAIRAQAVKPGGKFGSQFLADMGLRRYSMTNTSEFLADSYHVWLKGSRAQWNSLTAWLQEFDIPAGWLEGYWGPKP